MTTPKTKLGGLALIAVLVLLPCTSPAQQDPEEPPAALEHNQGIALEAPARQSETPKPSAQQEPPAAQSRPTALEHSQGIALEAPAPQSETPKPSAQQEPPATQPLSAAPVQSERSAEKPCGPRCQAAEQREKDDLEAQRSMAEAAFNLVVISWWQFGAGTIGIALLLATLWYTRKSTRAATAAADAAQAAVKEAQRQADATQATVKEARRQADATQAAVKEAQRQADATKATRPVGVSVTVKNIGDTKRRGVPKPK